MNTAAQAFKAPIVDPSTIKEVADGVWVIPDLDRIPMVPNIGIIVGKRATLVIDTGFGRDNARSVMEKARDLSGGRPIFLTHTHCHPEHGFGANVVADQVTVLYNTTQWGELQEKGPAILQMFRRQMPALASLLEGVEFIRPDILYSESLTLDLGGGPVVDFHEFGGAHSRGDQAIIVRGSTSVLFTGDLIEEHHFGLIADNESSVVEWIARLDRFERMGPDIVVPGHGHIGGLELIAEYRAQFELSTRRVAELRAIGELSEAEICERVTRELIEFRPDWDGHNWAAKTVSNLSWPSRA